MGAVVSSVADQIPTSNGDFNNTTDPLTVINAVVTYNAITFAVGTLIRISDEVFRVTAVEGNDVTFHRGEFQTPIDTHFNGAGTINIYTYDCAPGTAIGTVSISGSTVDSGSNTGIDAEFVNSGPTVDPDPPQTGDVAAVNIDGNTVDSCCGSDAINAGYLMGNISAETGGSLTIGPVSVSNNTIEDGDLNISQMLRRLGRANSESGSPTNSNYFDDVGDIILASLTVDGNTLNDDKLDGNNLLQYPGNVYASSANASVNSLTIGPVSVSNNAVEDEELDLDYLLAMNYSGDRMVYAGNSYTATLGDASIGNVTIDGNVIDVNNDSNDLSADYLLQGFGYIYAGGSSTANAGALALGTVSVSNNQLNLDCCAELELDCMLRYAGRVDAGESDTVTVDGFTVGNVSINGNTVDQLDAMHLLEYFVAVNEADSDANVDLSFTSLNTISLGDVSLNNNRSEDPDADYLLRKAGYVATSCCDATVKRGDIQIGLVTLNDNTLVTNCDHCDLDARNAFRLAAGTGGTIFGATVTLGDFTIAGMQVNGNTVSNADNEGDIHLENMFQDFAEFDAEGSSTITVGSITFGPLEVNGNTVFDDIDGDSIFKKAFDLDADSGANTTVDLATGVGESISFSGFSFDGNNLRDGGDLDLRDAFERFFDIDTSDSDSAVRVGPVSVGLSHQRQQQQPVWE